MEEYTNRQGVTFRVGQAVRAFHAGIYVLTRIEERKGYSPLFFYKKIATSDYVPLTPTSIKNGVERECDSDWCKLVTPEILRSELGTLIKNYSDTINLIESL